MGWFGAGIEGPLVAIRAIHFAATAMTGGALLFRAVVAGPALRSAPTATELVRSQILTMAWSGLAIAAASGVIWVQLQVAAMSGLPLSEVMTSDVLLTVLNETQFGLVSRVRFLLAIIIAACLSCDRFALVRWLALSSALGFIVAVAWTGHAGSTPGGIGNLHLTADALHFIAASAWIGGLVPLALLFSTVRRNRSLGWVFLARDAARRFSTLGVISVGTLLVSGIVNAWVLVGSLHALIVTPYGQLLVLKVAVFAIMLVFAGVNRFWLVPKLTSSLETDGQTDVLRQLTRSSVVEAALGFTIFAIVGMLGTLHPAIHGV